MSGKCMIQYPIQTLLLPTRNVVQQEAEGIKVSDRLAVRRVTRGKYVVDYFPRGLRIGPDFATERAATLFAKIVEENVPVAFIEWFGLRPREITDPVTLTEVRDLVDALVGGVSSYGLRRKN